MLKLMINFNQIFYKFHKFSKYTKNLILIPTKQTWYNKAIILPKIALCTEQFPTDVLGVGPT